MPPSRRSPAWRSTGFITGDCLERFRDVEDASIDLVFADPPFNIGYDYDVYDDRRDADAVSRLDAAVERARCVRVLKPDGTFWLAIGDEFAAELKVHLPPRARLSLRSWVIWYYTFGVNCTRKFSRSHAHLFHFVKDPKQFTFNDEAIRVPSARQLVYADARANPKGRLPDDTWILRPQDVPDGFAADERHLVLPPRLRHVQGARRLARLPDARAAPGPDHPRLLEPRRRRARPVRRQRHDPGRGQEARPPLPRLRALARIRRPDPGPARRRNRRPAAGRLRRAAGHHRRQGPPRKPRRRETDRIAAFDRTGRKPCRPPPSRHDTRRSNTSPWSGSLPSSTSITMGEMFAMAGASRGTT